MNRKNHYYGALVNQPEGSLPPAIYGTRHYVDFDPRLKFYVIATDSLQKRKAIQAVARENGCDMWMIQRSFLTGNLFENALYYYSTDSFRYDIERGHIFSTVYKLQPKFDAVRDKLREIGTFSVGGIGAGNNSTRIMIGDEHFEVATYEMREIRRLIKVEGLHCRNTGKTAEPDPTRGSSQPICEVCGVGYVRDKSDGLLYHQ